MIKLFFLHDLVSQTAFATSVFPKYKASCICQQHNKTWICSQFCMSRTVLFTLKPIRKLLHFISVNMFTALFTVYKAGEYFLSLKSPVQILNFPRNNTFPESCCRLQKGKKGKGTQPQNQQDLMVCYWVIQSELMWPYQRLAGV